MREKGCPCPNSDRSVENLRTSGRRFVHCLKTRRKFNTKFFAPSCCTESARKSARRKLASPRPHCTPKPICLIRPGWPRCCPQFHHRRSQSRISAHCRHQCAGPLSMHMPTIPGCRYTNSPGSAMCNSIASPRTTPFSWCWRTALSPRARHDDSLALTRLPTRQSGAA